MKQSARCRVLKQAVDFVTSPDLQVAWVICRTVVHRWTAVGGEAERPASLRLTQQDGTKAGVVQRAETDPVRKQLVTRLHRPIMVPVTEEAAAGVRPMYPWRLTDEG
jgi:hypothetical protein